VRNRPPLLTMMGSDSDSVESGQMTKSGLRVLAYVVTYLQYAVEASPLVVHSVWESEWASPF